MITVRSAAPEDAARLVEIFDYYVRETAISFDYVTPSEDEFRERIIRTLRHYPYLVAEEIRDTYAQKDTGGEKRILGYAYAGPFVGRAAYSWSAEMTIYLDPDCRGRGIGRVLYEALEDALGRMGILNLYACIGWTEKEDPYLTNASAYFHEHMGYERVGTFHRCGLKFGRWYDMIWMEKIIGRHTDAPPPALKA